MSGSVGGMASESDVIEIVAFIVRISFHYTSQLILWHCVARRPYLRPYWILWESCDLYQLAGWYSYQFCTKLFTKCRYLSPFGSSVTFAAWGYFTPSPLPVYVAKKPSPVWGLSDNKNKTNRNSTNWQDSLPKRRMTIMTCMVRRLRPLNWNGRKFTAVDS